MKHTLFTAAALLLVAAVGCDVDHVGAVYTPSGDNDAVTFSKTVVVDQEILSSATTYPIDLVRSKSNGSISVALDMTKLPEGITGPASVDFADGETSTQILLDVSAMEVGNTYKGVIHIKDETSFEKGVAIDSVSLTLAKAYTWVEKGKGLIYDGLALAVDDDNLGITEVEIMQAEGFNRWRIMNPFPKEQLFEAWGEDYYCGGGSDYWEFYVLDKTVHKDVTADVVGETLKFDTIIKTGLAYVGLGDDCYIWYYYPSAYNSKYAAYDAYNTFVDTGVVQFCDARTIENSGGYWFNFGFQYVCLPGVMTKAEFEAWLNE